jgi:hypothetical protein
MKSTLAADGKERRIDEAISKVIEEVLKKGGGNFIPTPKGPG